jgi:hypothetical protein
MTSSGLCVLEIESIEKECITMLVNDPYSIRSGFPPILVRRNLNTVKVYFGYKKLISIKEAK